MRNVRRWRAGVGLALIVLVGGAGPRTDRHGDPLPDGALARLGTVRFRVPGALLGIGYGADGKTLIAAAGTDLVVWDASDGKVLDRINAAQREVGVMAVSPDGKFVAWASRDQAFATALRVWDLAKKEKVHEQAVARCYGLQWSSDGKRLLQDGGDGELTVWDTAKWKEPRKFSALTDQNRFSSSLALSAISGDGKTVAGTTPFNNADTLVWDVATREVRLKAPRMAGVRALALSDDGATLALATGTEVELWNVAKGAKLRALADKPSAPSWLRFLDGGKRLIGGGYGWFTVWDVATGKRLGGGGVEARPPFALSPDGKRLANVTGSAVVQWDLEAYAVLPQGDGHIYPPGGVGWSADGPRVVTWSLSDSRARTWDPATGKPGKPVTPAGANERFLALTEDGRTLIANQYGQDLALYDTDTGQPRQRFAYPQGRKTSGYPVVRLTPDGRLLSGSTVYEGQGRRSHLTGWDAAGRVEFDVNDVVTDRPALFAPDGSWAAWTSRDDYRSPAPTDGASVELRDARSGRVLRTLPEKLPSARPVVVTADGRLLVTLSYKWGLRPIDVNSSMVAAVGPYTLRVWECATGKPVCAADFDTPEAPAVAFAPGGRVLAVAPAAAPVKLIDAFTGKEVGKVAVPPAKVSALAFSPDGRKIATAHADTTVLIWEVPAAFETAAGPADAAWNDLGSDDPAKAYAAVAALVARPAEAVALLKEKVQPSDPAGAERVKKLIAELDANAFVVRERASRQLEQLDEVEPYLREALDMLPTGEARRRVEKALQKLSGPITNPERLRPLRAVHALESIGTDDARGVLRALADGASVAKLTRDAKAALDRLNSGARSASKGIE